MRASREDMRTLRKHLINAPTHPSDAERCAVESWVEDREAQIIISAALARPVRRQDDPYCQARMHLQSGILPIGGDDLCKP